MVLRPLTFETECVLIMYEAPNSIPSTENRQTQLKINYNNKINKTKNK